MKVEFVEAQLEHVIALVDNLRDRELDLCRTMYGRDFEKMIVAELQASVLTYAGVVDGECGALWGVKAQFFNNYGTLWMIGTRLIDEHPIAFLRHSRRALLDLRGTFSRLYGCVLTDYAQSRRWLEWLGFEIGPDQNGICLCEYRSA
jgi:hypothetical protein